MARLTKVERKESLRFSKNLSFLREVSELSLRQVQERTGIHFMTVRSLEQGTQLPRWDQAIALARLFKVSLDHFLREVK